MLFILMCLLFNVVDGIPLGKMHNSSKLVGVPVAKMQNSDIISLILTSKDDNKALLNVLADADPAKIVEIISLLQALLSTSQNELAALVAAAGSANSAYDDAVTVYNAAVVAKTTGTVQLQTDYDQGVAALQNAVDAAQAVVDSTTTAKNTANGVLSADRVRLDSEVATLTNVIGLLQALIGINTFSPTASPTTNAPVSEWTYIGVEGGCMTDNCGARGSYWDNTLDDCAGNCHWGASYRKSALSSSECEAEASSRDFVVAYAHSTNTNQCWLYVEGNPWDGTSGWSGVETHQHARIGCTYKPTPSYRCYLKTA